jgi:serine/threonine protein kinase
VVVRTLSHYKILDEISRGGMGIVYRAVDTKLNREVALKVLPEELIAEPERKRRFIQEAQAAASLEHPNIAVIYEIDEAEGMTFIVMELIRGEKLSELIKRERLSLARVLDLTVGVAEGLAQAHDKGIVHRDLKPANIMLTSEGRPKIIDFGLAKLVEPMKGGDTEAPTALRRETDPGNVMGTVSYMSPEQARGAKADHRSDVFSFGIVLHELLTGTPPFQGPTGIDTLHAILRDRPPELSALGPDVTPEAGADLQRILDKCLEKEPSERYQTMKDLAVDLRHDRGTAGYHGVSQAAPSPLGLGRWGSVGWRDTARVALPPAPAPTGRPRGDHVRLETFGCRHVIRQHQQRPLSRLASHGTDRDARDRSVSVAEHGRALDQSSLSNSGGAQPTG